MPVVIAEVTGDPLDVDEHVRAVENPQQGAVAVFVGRVRDHDPQVDGEVVRLSYSAHPDASSVIVDIANKVVRQHDPAGESIVALTHRIGELDVGEAAIVAAVSSPHRSLAFEICHDLVDEVKRSLPIWKKQHDADGGAVWSGLA